MKEVTSTQQDNTVLSFKNVSKEFVTDSRRKVQALKDINLNISSGCFVTVVGPTGCGKTTLLNLAAGLLDADDGIIRFADEINDKRDVAYVFQHYTLLPWLSTEKNVAFGLMLRGFNYKKRMKQARGLLEQVGLSECAKAYPHELSGGMRQRVAIAQALAVNPKILLMDEPFGAVDDSTRSELQAMIAGLQEQQKITVLFVTHSIDEAVALGDQIVVFDPAGGKVLKEIEVKLPKPRNVKSKEFNEIFMEIRRLLSVG